MTHHITEAERHVAELQHPKTDQFIDPPGAAWSIRRETAYTSFLAGATSAAPKWVPAEQLPEERTYCLVVQDGAIVLEPVMFVVGDFRSPMRNYTIPNVTHWMPIAAIAPPG